MTPTRWHAPLPGGGTSEEFALCFDADRAARLLIVPALFDEGNKLRRLTVEVMRRLDAAGIDSLLPDLPGCNESLQPLPVQTPVGWLDAMAAAARHFGATHTVGIRGGSLFTPRPIPMIHYAPVKGAAILRQMLRARILSSREAGREEQRETLVEAALHDGITLAGYELSADFYRHFEPMTADGAADIITQDAVGGAGLWLRAEPGEDAGQADALAVSIAALLDGRGTT